MEEKNKIDKMFHRQRLDYAKKNLSDKEYLILKLLLYSLSESDGIEGTVDDLHRSTIKMNKGTTKKTNWLIGLTIATLILTAIIVFLTKTLIDYAKIQNLPVIEQQAENKRRALNYCESCQGLDCEWSRPDGTMMDCSYILEVFKD